MKIMTVIGARPQFIKAAAVSRIIKKNYEGRIQEILLHTGQHYDENMSKIFFEQLDISRPHINLNISGGNHGSMTGRMIIEIEKHLISEKPDMVLVYGDTNSTLAASISASKLNIPISHVEAGLRSFNMNMPEEVNRILTDRVSHQLFCPTSLSVRNLHNEGINKGVYNVGDVMYDIAIHYGDKLDSKKDYINDQDYILATLHRAENTDSLSRMKSIIDAFQILSKDMHIILPLHPRTKNILKEYKLSEKLNAVEVIEPQSYLDMIALEKSAKVILTDSGGIQKEAFFYQVPCVTMRDETEWRETIESGWNVLVGADSNSIVNNVRNFYETAPRLCSKKPYGNGDASLKITDTIYREFN